MADPGISGRQGSDLNALTVSPRAISFYRTLSRVLGAMVSITGAAVLLGWAFDVTALKSLFPNLVTMKANTAFCFVLIGLCLFLLNGRDIRSPNKWLKKAAILIMASVVALTGLLTLAEYVFHLNFGMDQLLFKEGVNAVSTSTPGRMAPNTAFNFAAIGFALLLIDTKSPRGRGTAQALIFAAGFVSMVGSLGYIYETPQFYGLTASVTAMAAHTAIAFTLVLSVFFWPARIVTWSF